MQALKEQTQSRAGSLTLITVIIYMILHAYWRQTVYGSYSFVILRVLFLAALIGILSFRKQPDAIGHYFVGRIVPESRHWKAVCLLLVLIVAGRALMEWIHPFPLEACTLHTFADECMVPSVNEELVFRGVVLCILLDSLPGRQGTAILLSTLIFATSHNLGENSPLLPLLVCGTLLGYVYAQTRSVPCCMICHALWNAFAFIPILHSSSL